MVNLIRGLIASTIRGHEQVTVVGQLRVREGEGGSGLAEQDGAALRLRDDGWGPAA